MLSRLVMSTQWLVRRSRELRLLLSVLAAGGALLAAGVALLAAAGPSRAALPTVSVPTLSVPSVTVPSATVPSATVGPVTTPPVNTPTVATPTVSTPPSVPVQTPPIGTTKGSPPNTGTTSRSTGSRDATVPAASTPASTASASAPTVSQPSRGTAGHAGGAGRSAAGRSGGTQSTAAPRRTSAPTHTQPRPPTVAAGLAAAARTASHSPTASGSRTPTPPAAAPKPAAGPIRQLVKELPTAVLVALLAFAVIAAAMALNAYLQSRRARSLAGQREALLSDVGVLQAALLPAVPENLGDLDVSVAYRPAQGLAAGGDFFDVFTLSPDRTGIIIGDVSGHGRESLIHAALVRYTLRTLMGEGHPLPEVLARADRYLTGELGDGFATVIICRYEHATAELTWAKAGHEPPIIAGQPDLEEEAATPLGFGLGDSWPEFSRFLAPGERVCLFTDGLIEARRSGQYLGRAHLSSLVEQGLSAQALLDRVQEDSDECSDDLAAVLISRAPDVASVEARPAQQTAAV